MSRFHGPQPGFKTGTTKGVVRRFLRERAEKIAAEQKRKNRLPAETGTEELAQGKTSPDSVSDSSSDNDNSGNDSGGTSPLEP